jgi:putative salt-induced outer membrane protein YdiY
MDRVELLNGSLIIGRFIDADNGTVTMQTEFAGALEIDQSRIASMDVRSSLTLQMEDGSVLETSTLVVADQTLALDDTSDANYAIDQLTRINPEPWELGRGYKPSGIASTAFTLQRGNTVLEELDYKLEARWRSLYDRYTLRLDGEMREANRTRTAENWMIAGKYDRFQVGDYYWGIAASAEENRFADLDLRTSIGPYVGRNLLEDTPFPLELETGLSQVNEDFANDADRSYVGLTWSLRSESDYLGNDSRLFVDHKGVKNLAERNNLILNTTVGLTFPLIGQIQGATELVLDYNSGAVAGTEELDQTYRIRLGYSW